MLKRLPLIKQWVTGKKDHFSDRFQFDLFHFLVRTRTGHIDDIIHHFRNKYSKESILFAIERYALLGYIKNRGQDSEGKPTWAILRSGEWKYYCLCEPTWIAHIKGCYLKYMMGFTIEL